MENFYSGVGYSLFTKAAKYREHNLINIFYKLNVIESQGTVLVGQLVDLTVDWSSTQ